ncbi:ATP-binding cassette domain-containing protein [Streptomyces huasconensis]|uniref:ATP-binding cassette domain-containing protein n=1 Tax=Streptomyces huasconensis TaxID=1854574 RepID=UPI0033CB3640
MIEAVRIGRTFGRAHALREVCFRAEKGEVLCLLGHNGAGKSTLVSILTTLLPPTSGSAKVAGFDVVSDGHEVRSRIGLTGQFASVDESLTGRANLVLVARLLGANRREAAARADELLERFALTDAADRAARTYSGGMRRRLDLASSMVGHPQVLFLDEPTTGLDPVRRNELWDVVKGLVADGTTVLLTTQYLEEADQLADRIVVLGQGRTIAEGTAAELKSQVGVSTVHADLADPAAVDDAVAALKAAGLAPAPAEAPGSVSAPVESSLGLSDVVRALDGAGVALSGLALREPTLDDVYLALTGSQSSEPAGV